MRDECIGIPPRFHCEYCPSKFRRKYHLVRHLSSKHGIHQNELKPKTLAPAHSPSSALLTPLVQLTNGGSPAPSTYTHRSSHTDTDNENMGDNVMPPAAAANGFSVEALMMKQEPADPVAPIDFSYHPSIGAPVGGPLTSTEDGGDVKLQTDALQQTFQNLKYLFVNYAMNNVPNFST